uniref:Armadillo repeat-containing protein 8 n=1 Tax=Octactis speculum TaxID=3111310 RepID=A0A7S2CPM0_9STRA
MNSVATGVMLVENTVDDFHQAATNDDIHQAVLLASKGLSRLLCLVQCGDTKNEVRDVLSRVHALRQRFTQYTSLQNLPRYDLKKIGAVDVAGGILSCSHSPKRRNCQKNKVASSLVEIIPDGILVYTFQLLNGYDLSQVQPTCRSISRLVRSAALIVASSLYDARRSVLHHTSITGKLHLLELKASRIRGLMTVFHSSDKDAKAEAVTSLVELCHMDPAIVPMMSALGALPCLVSDCLVRGHDGMGALYELLTVGTLRATIANTARSVPRIVALLNSDDTNAVAGAARVLRKLSENLPGATATDNTGGAAEDNSKCLLACIADAGAIPPLVALLDRSACRTCRESSVWALRNLAMADYLHRKIANAGAVLPLVALLEEPDGACCLRGAVGALMNLSCSLPLKTSIAEAGAVPRLVALLAINDDPCLQRKAAGTLANLAQFNCEKACLRIVTAGAIPKLLSLLGDRECICKCEVAYTLECLVDEKILRRTLVTAGAIPVLLDVFMDRSAGAARGHAVMALGGLMIDDPGVVDLVVQSRGPEEIWRILGDNDDVEKKEDLELRARCSFAMIPWINKANAVVLAKSGAEYFLLYRDPRQPTDIRRHLSRALQRLVALGGQAACKHIATALGDPYLDPSALLLKLDKTWGSL